MRFGIASRPASGMVVNGDAYLTKEWDGQTLVALIDALGHGEGASVVCIKAREYVLENFANDVEKLVMGLHVHLHGPRGAAAGLARVDRPAHRICFCGVGNIDVTIDGEPPMHPASREGIIGMNISKTTRFQYEYKSFKALILHSDGISSRFALSDYPLIYKQPQSVAERILADWGSKNDDATIIIGVEEPESMSTDVSELVVSSNVRALAAAEQAKDLAKIIGFSEADQSKIAIATSELAQNIAVHAFGKGRIVIKPITELNREGIMVIAEDSGPGIANIEKALEGISGSSKGLGIGLGGAKRLMDEFKIETKVGKGTTVTIIKWRNR